MKKVMLLLSCLFFSCKKNNLCKKKVRDVNNSKEVITLWIPRNIHNYSLGDTVYLKTKDKIFSDKVVHFFVTKRHQKSLA